MEGLILKYNAEDKEGLVICSAAPRIMKQKQRLTASECIWKITYLNHGYRYEDILWSSQLYTQLKQLWNYSLRLKNWFRLERYSNSWPAVPALPCNIAVSVKDTSEYVKDHIWLETLWVQKQLPHKYRLSSTENKTRRFSPQKRLLVYRPLHMLRKADWLQH